MDTATIDKILSRNQETKKFYHGCFPANQLLNCKSFPCTMVVNTDPANEPGSHWCALFAPNKQVAYFFDSYGDKPNEFVEKYLKANFDQVVRNRRPFQSIISNVCGHYTIFVIHLLSLGLSYEKILKLLASFTDPDSIVFNYVNEIKDIHLLPFAVGHRANL